MDFGCTRLRGELGWLAFCLSATCLCGELGWLACCLSGTFLRGELGWLVCCLCGTCLCGELGWMAGLLVAGMVRLAGPLAAFFISSWVVFSCSTIFSRSSWFTCNFLI